MSAWRLVRLWPRAGVDVAVFGGYRWVENAGHVTGVDDDGATAAIALRLLR